MPTLPSLRPLPTLLSPPLAAHAPPFIHLTTPPPLSPHTTSRALRALFATSAPTVRAAHVDAIQCFTPRILFDSVLNALARWEVRWSKGCANAHAWTGGEGVGGFVEGLQAVWERLHKEGGEGNAVKRLVIAIDNAERLKSTAPDLLVPLARLAELARLPLTVLLHSPAGWDALRPPGGGAPDPFFVDVPPLSQAEMHAHLLASYPSESPAYPAHLKSLYASFLSTVLAVLAPLTGDADAAAYVAAAVWGPFSAPLRARSSPAEPTESERTALATSRALVDAVQRAADALLPRRTHAGAYASDAHSNLDTAAEDAKGKGKAREPANEEEMGLDALPRIARFVLVASFLASANPPKTDVRMFGRLASAGKKRRRGGRAGGGGRRGGRGGASKVPQRLLGPLPFPLDRMLAILGVLLEEHDADADAREEGVPGEGTELELGRVGVYTAIQTLTRARLLHALTPPDKFLDGGGPVYRCGVGYEDAVRVARGLGLGGGLGGWMWEG